MLLNSRWSPEGGASIATSFITQCLFQFPNVHRWWRREHEPGFDLPGDMIRAAVQLMSEGYSARQAAEQLGVKPKKIENALTRYRQKKRPQDEGGRTKR
jgi:hypothetical protein